MKKSFALLVAAMLLAGCGLNGSGGAGPDPGESAGIESADLGEAAYERGDGPFVRTNHNLTIIRCVNKRSVPAFSPRVH